MKKVLAIPDLHAPFTDLNALSKVYKIAAALKPDVVIQLGDAFDLFCFSRFPHSLNLMTPKHEIEEARAIIEIMWKEIKAIVPAARCIQLFGNHQDRVGKRVLEALPGLHTVISLKDIFTFRGVECAQDERTEILIDGVLYIHGHLTQPGQHMKYYNQSVVRAHSHKASLNFMQRRNEMIFELECGNLVDQRAQPLQYTKSTTTHWMKAVGVIEPLGPRIIPV